MFKKFKRRNNVYKTQTEINEALIKQTGDLIIVCQSLQETVDKLNKEVFELKKRLTNELDSFESFFFFRYIYNYYYGGDLYE